MDVDPRLRAATLEQLARRREALTAGATRVGWKLGMGERESIGGSIAVGYLTSATQIESGGTYGLGGLAAELRADVELAVELGAGIDPLADASAVPPAIAGYATALEIVDLAPVLEGSEAVVSTNLFHRAVTFGPFHPALPKERLRASIHVNGEKREVADVNTDLSERLLAAARILDAPGERLTRGDRIITGSVIQIRINAGDDVTADVAGLGSVRVQIVG
jgi:2-keto-4-pentenoate hydratase